MAFNSFFNYIVVGGGQSGLVVASRLSEDTSKTVLVIEAGANTMEDEKVTTPGFMTTLYGDSRYDWNFKCVPQTHVNNRVISCPRGKGLGGSSSVNFGSVSYASRTDFESWVALGNEGWGFDEMAGYYRKSETFCLPDDDDAAQELYKDDIVVDLHGRNGPVRIGYNADYSNFNEAWTQTFQKLGHDSTGDVLGGKKLGSFRIPITVDPETSKRVSSATAYYGPAVAARPNLTVWTESFVEKVILEKTGEDVVAKGVELTNLVGERRRIAATSEVILAAGSIKSPQLLELSGIGGRDLLEKYGIPVFIDNANVGENLQDHPQASISFEVGEDMWSGDLFKNPHFFQAVYELYKSTGTGPLAGTPLSLTLTPLVDENGKSNTKESKTLLEKYLHGAEYPSFPSQEQQYKLIADAFLDQEQPSTAYMFIPLQINTSKNTPMSRLFGKEEPENYITVVAMTNRPLSRGVVHIKSSDPKAHPTYDPRYLSHPLDLEILARLMQYIEKIVSTEPFSTLLNPDGRRLPSGSMKNIEDAKLAVKDRLYSSFSPIGTCAMMPRHLGGVVNEKLLVHGTMNLRVVDASIFPLQPLGNIQATVYAVAEKAADLIKGTQKS